MSCVMSDIPAEGSCTVHLMSLHEEKTEIGDTTLYPNINIERQRYPFCIVWTPIPLLTWLFPIIGHTGIATSHGVIRDFAGFSYHVNEDNMAFGSPTKYWQLDPDKVAGGAATWDSAVAEAADFYKGRKHNLCCDNSYSMVATALNNMKYNNSSHWNMVNVACMSFLCSKYVSTRAWFQTWLPFLLWALILGVYIAVVNGMFFLYNWLLELKIL